jgi:Bacteriophage translational regulator
MNEFDVIDWTPEELLEVNLSDPDSFLKIRETLTRIGIAAKKENILYQSCHILHKRGKYYIVHFKEMFALEGKPSDITLDDLIRRNTIAKLLEQWGLCKLVSGEQLQTTNMSNIKVIPHKEKNNWVVKPKYKMLSDRIREKNS